MLRALLAVMRKQSKQDEHLHLTMSENFTRLALKLGIAQMDVFSYCASTKYQVELCFRFIRDKWCLEEIKV